MFAGFLVYRFVQKRQVRTIHPEDGISGEESNIASVGSGASDVTVVAINAPLDEKKECDVVNYFHLMDLPESEAAAVVSQAAPRSALTNPSNARHSLNPLVRLQDVVNISDL